MTERTSSRNLTPIGVTGMLLLMMWHTMAVAADISASVDRNPVSIDESFTLTLRAEGEPDGDPDLRPLNKDFDILGSSQNTSMNYINGTFERTSSWNISLIGKRTGNLTIPSIAFGKDQSPSLRINIREASAATSGTEQNLFLEAETDTDRTWVQGQVIYTLRLFRNVEINSASLTPPRTDDPDAIIEKLGEDIAYESFRNGVRFDVIERRFAIFPQQSGTLRIEPTLFEGRIGQRRSIFDSRQGNNRIKRLRSAALEVDIAPVPTLMAGDDWIPARRLGVVDEWSQPLDQLTAGEPVTRTISIDADGVLASQLPVPAFADIDNIKQYPDQPKNGQTSGRDGISATRQIKLAMIPAAPGRYRIPELRLPWWNTDSGQREVAIIPAQNIVVAPGATAPPPATLTTIQDETIPSIPPVTERESGQQTVAGAWPWVSLALALAWLSTLGLWWRQRHTARDTAPSLKVLRQRLLRACDDDDGLACKSAMIAWARARWPEQRIHNLMDVTPLLDAPIADRIRELNSSLYSEHQDAWSGAELSDLIAALPLKDTLSASAVDPVEPLYRH